MKSLINSLGRKIYSDFNLTIKRAIAVNLYSEYPHTFDAGFVLLRYQKTKIVYKL